MGKFSLQDLKGLFSGKGIQMDTQSTLNPFKKHSAFRGGKHQASKKGFKHEKRLSRGELNSLNISLEKKYRKQ